MLFTQAATIDSRSGENNNLTCDAGAGSVSFNANLGAIQPIGALTVTQADGGVFFGHDSSGANPDLHPLATIDTTGQINITGGAITFDGGPRAADTITVTTPDEEVRINGPVALDSSLTVNTSGGNMLFTSAATIDSRNGENNDLTLDAGGGSISFNANLGSSQPLGMLIVTQADGGVYFGNNTSGANPDLHPLTTINTSGQIDINCTTVSFDGGPGAANLLTISTTGGNVRVNGPVTLDSSLTVNTSGGNVLFTPTATIDSQSGESNNLSFSAGSGSVSFNADLGSAQPLGTLTVTQADSGVFLGNDPSGANPDLHPLTTVNTTGQIDVSGGVVVFDGGPLTANLLTITTTGGGVRINGPATLDSSLTVNTAGGIVLFTQAATIDSRGGENNNLKFDAGSGSISFNGNLGATQPIGTLTVTRADGGVFFGNDPSGADLDLHPLTSINTTGPIDITGGSIVFDGGPGAANVLTVTTPDEEVRINGPVTLDSSLAINTSGGNILFTSVATIDSQSGESNNLTLSSAVGTVTFNANLGGNVPLGDLTVQGTTGQLTFGGAGSATAGSDDGPVTLISTAGAIDLAPIWPSTPSSSTAAARWPSTQPTPRCDSTDP